MTDRDWRDLVVGDRMAVDQAFAKRVRGSGLTNQEWSLVMTAVQLDIEGSGDGARLVADTSRIPVIIPEIAKVNRQLGRAGGGPDGGNGGFLGSLKGALGLGGGADDELQGTAEALANEYAQALETHLRERGRWDDVLATAAGG